jgi:hypothetical protein
MSITLFGVKHPRHGYVTGSDYTQDKNNADLSTVFLSARATITEPGEFVVVFTRDENGELVEVACD